ncbi:hypothetical protein DR74_2216 [Enterobacter cloacae]|nr:hypothetical protein DR74_2216 [Enterobacter cloacae]
MKCPDFFFGIFIIPCRENIFRRYLQRLLYLHSIWIQAVINAKMLQGETLITVY